MAALTGPQTVTLPNLSGSFAVATGVLLPIGVLFFLEVHMAPVAWNLYSRLAILFLLAAGGVEARIVKLRGCGCSGAVLIHVCVFVFCGVRMGVWVCACVLVCVGVSV